jgi:hypothetical protein
MARLPRLVLAVAILFSHAATAEAQVFFGPPPVVGIPVHPPGGIGFHYHGHRVRVAGFLASGPGYGFGPFYSPYAVIQNRVVVQPIAPTVIVAPRSFVPPAPAYDLSGIDLDVEPPSRLFGDNPPPGVRDRPEVARVVPPPPAPRPPAEKRPVAKAPAKPPVEQPVDDLAKPRGVPAEEAERLVQLGRRAFRAQGYGVAARRFQQALDTDPAHHRAAFLLGQAHFALGQFRLAARAIEEGLLRNPKWPAARFEPRQDFYADHPDAWREHLDRLKDAVELQPQNADFRFLLAYQFWFDGRRAEAERQFRAARPLTADPRFIDLFLKPAAGPVAVR